MRGRKHYEPVTVSIVARRLGLSESTVRRLVDLGKLPAVRTSSTGVRLIDAQDVEAFERRQRSAGA